MGPLCVCFSLPTCIPHHPGAFLAARPIQSLGNSDTARLPSTAPTPQFGGQGRAGDVYSQPGGDSWSWPCWGVPLEGDIGVAQLLLCHKG